MRVRSIKKIESRTYTDMNVTSDVNGAVVFHGRMDNGDFWHKPISPREAVQLWRRMIGDTDEALHIQSPHLDVKYDDGEGTWTFSDENVLCVLDFDECMAVAWAIEKAVGIALYNCPLHQVHDNDRKSDPVHPVQDNDLKSEEKTSGVWLLVSSSRPGPCSSDKEYCRSLGGNAKVFSSREAALDGLREFLRDEVNKAYDEINWKELADHGRTVDDILDEIIEMEEGNPAGVWMYDGAARSFVVQLMKEEVVN